MSVFALDLAVRLLTAVGIGKELLSTELVPGDIFELSPGLAIVPCDAALLAGDALVNESMLTGESVPVTRRAIPVESDHFRYYGDKKYTLFAGTHLMRVRGELGRRVTAVVLKTGTSAFLVLARRLVSFWHFLYSGTYLM